MKMKYSTIFAMMLLASGLTCAQTNSADTSPKSADTSKKADVAWVSYRNAYKAMIQFEKYGKPKHFIQNHFQVVSKTSQPLPDDLQLILVSKSMRLSLPLDAVGRANFPLLKAAYDENAELMLNQAVTQVDFQGRISIVPRADGVYDMADLRTACEQAQTYLKTVGDARVNGKSCVGVRFSFPKNLKQAGISFRGADLHVHVLLVQEAAAFPDESSKVYKTASLKFNEWPDKGQILAQQMPLAIAPVFE